MHITASATLCGWGGGGGVSKECLYACASKCLLDHPSLFHSDLISTELRLPWHPASFPPHPKASSEKQNIARYPTHTHTHTLTQTPSFVYVRNFFQSFIIVTHPESLWLCLCHSLSVCLLPPVPTFRTSVTLLLMPLRYAPTPPLLLDPCHSSLAFFTSSLCLPFSIACGGASVLYLSLGRRLGGWTFNGGSLFVFVSEDAEGG